MDEILLAKNCGCVSMTCNNCPSGFQWCSNYSCSYTRSTQFGGRKKKSKAPVEKSLIQQQREAQNIVMEKLKKRWEREEREGVRGGEDALWRENHSDTGLQDQQLASLCTAAPPDDHPVSLNYTNGCVDFVVDESCAHLGQLATEQHLRIHNRPEAPGHYCTVDVTTNSLGYRPQRRHIPERPTFLWLVY